MSTLTKDIHNCKKCKLSSLLTDCCSPVSHIGNPQAKIMVVTDHPREEGIILSEPLSLKEQTFLFNLIPLKFMYITNLLKCNPVNDKKERSPHKQEIKICSSWLEQEISAVNPEFILCLGKNSVQYFLPAVKKVDAVAGTDYTINGRTVIPFYSISGLLNRSKDDISQFKLIAKRLINAVV